ncbi:MAG TPA: hypothetical protein VGD52_08875 [Pseudoduganella sp.]
MQDLKQMAALTALNDMMSKGRFDICAIRSIGEMLGIKAAGEEYQILQPLHMIEFAKMPPELSDAIPGLIQKVLGVAPVYQFKTMRQEVIEVTPQREVAPQRRGFLQLLGGK